MKFGGTSVASHTARCAAAHRVIAAKEEGFSPVVVVSAIGRKGAPYATDTLIGEVLQVDPQISPEARELDLIMACGEILSSVIFAQTLNSLGTRASAMTGGQAGILTDGSYGRARIRRIEPENVLKTLQWGRVPVVCGFQGIAEHENGEVTTLGRGGSDTTAAALGAALNAHAVEIFTDVDGVKTANPEFVPTAPTLRQVSYDEVAEIAHLGAKVLHPRAAEIAMRYGIPLWVKNTFGNDNGTEIVGNDVSYERSVTGVTHTGRLVYLQFNLQSTADVSRSEIKARVFELMSENGLNLFMMNMSPSGIGFGVPREQFPIVRELLDGLVVPVKDEAIYVFQLGRSPSREVQTQMAQLKTFGHVHKVEAELTENCTMVSVIGRRYFGIAGVFFTLLSALSDAKIPVYQTSDSDFSVGCLIPESDTGRAVNLLHECFGLRSVG